MSLALCIGLPGLDGASGSAPPNLAADTQVFWPLGEASGARADATASALTLTDTNTVTSAAGRVGDGALFTRANTESLDRADGAVLSISTSFEWWGWVKLTSKPVGGNMYLISKGTDLEYNLLYRNAAAEDRFACFVKASEGILHADLLGSPTIGTLYFIRFGYNSATGKLFICVDNGAKNELTVATAPVDGAGAFKLGDYVSGGNALDGMLDAVGMVKRILTDEEASWLYNGGSGREYPFA